MDTLRWIFTAVLAIVLAGCAGSSVEAPSVAAPTLYAWHPDGLTGEPRITIDLRRQLAYVTMNGELAGWATVATGKEGFSTPAGNFTILEKIVDKHSTLYGVTVDSMGNVVNPDADVRRHRPPPGGEFRFAPMPYWMRITWGGIGMHAGYIPQPGEPASHGCIRLPEDFAPVLYDAVRIGTPVRVIR